MRTKTGLALKERAEAILQIISGMKKKPKSFALAINPVQGEDYPNVVSDILSAKDFLRENALSFRRTSKQIRRIVIFVRP